MSTPGPTTRKIPLFAVVTGAVVVAGLVISALYLSRPAPKATLAEASAEARAYLSHLDLKDVTMKATENFMNQQVVEVEGSISNKGPRPLRSIDVYCLFYGIDGHELSRQRVPVIPASAAALKPGESRHFRLPFDNLPNGWNQAMPKMVIAQITFAG